MSFLPTNDFLRRETFFSKFSGNFVNYRGRGNYYNNRGYNNYNNRGYNNYNRGRGYYNQNYNNYNRCGKSTFESRFTKSFCDTG